MAHTTPSQAAAASHGGIALLLGAALLLAAAIGHFSSQDRKADAERDLKGTGRYATPSGEESRAWAPVSTYEAYDRLALSLGGVGVLVLTLLGALQLSRPRVGGDRGEEQASGSARWRGGCRVICSGCGDLGPGGSDEWAAHERALREGYQLVAGVGWRCEECGPDAPREVVPVEGDGREVLPG